MLLQSSSSCFYCLFIIQCLLFVLFLHIDIDWSDRQDKEHTVKPVLSGHSKIDKIKVLKTGGSLMQVESIAECSKGEGSILQYF